MCSSITVFLLEGALIREVYGYLHFLPDILAWRDTSSHTRTVGTPFISARFSRIVQPFVRRHVRELTHVMHITNAVITGSCAMKMLTGGEGYMNNINFVIAHGTLDVFQSFIQDKLIYRWATTKPHYAFQSALTSYTVYRRSELFITVSEAKIDGMFSVIASSPTTADMTMMTPGGFATFYPHWTLKRVAVLNQTLLRGDHAVHAVGCYTHPEFECHENTYWLGPACHTLCPALWRNIADGGKQSLVLQWDARFSLASMLARSHTIWRLADRCANLYCMYNPSNNVGTSLLPPDPMPFDLISVQLQEQRIDKHYPRYTGRRVGLLYATSASSPYLVSVPFLDGVNCFTHISQLEVSHWVDRLIDDRFIVSTSKLRKTYNVTSDASAEDTAYSYTFYRESPSSFAPPNLLV